MLTLLSYIYWLIWVVRRWLYETGFLKSKRLPCPVICIGNITVGGTGKTPTVIALTKLLQNPPSPPFSKGAGLPLPRSIATGRGGLHRIAILTRGYKRRSKDPVMVVSDGNKIVSDPQDAGDEPYLIATILKDVPVIVGADRYRSGRYAIEHFGTNLLILDDGYQHIKLHRDINILLIDATNPFGNRYLLPKGILREPLPAISRAGCIIISRANEGDKRYVEGLVRSYNKDCPVFYAAYKATGVWRGHFPYFHKENRGSVPIADNTLGLDYIRGKNILLFSGIGNPNSFRMTVENISGKIIGEIIFPDHHWYTIKDVERILKEAYRLSVDCIMTTEKDSVRLVDSHLQSQIQDKKEILVLQIEMDIDNRFGEWIHEKVAERVRRAPHTCYLK